MLGAPPARTFLSVTLPLSLPGIFAAAVFGFVGCFGESAVPVIMGGVGYQLMGNTITSTMDVLNYPLAAAHVDASSSLAMVVLLARSGIWLSTCGPSSARSCAGGCRRMGPARRRSVTLAGLAGYVVLVLAVLYRAAGSAAHVLARRGREAGGSLRYAGIVEMWRNPILPRAIVTSLEVG